MHKFPVHRLLDANLFCKRSMFPYLPRTFLRRPMSVYTPSRSTPPPLRLDLSFASKLNLPNTRRVSKDGGMVLSWDTPLEKKQNEGELGDVSLEFIEEPLGVGATNGFGYLQVEFGDRIGPDNRYEILRKLGWGAESSVWLAKDTVNNQFVAIKAMTGYTTNMVRMGVAFEADILEELSYHEKDTRGTHCLYLLDDFVQPSKDKADWGHLCMVIDLCGPSVASLRTTAGRFSISLLKKILLDILGGLHHLHSLGIVYTDLRLENIMMDLATGPHALDIETFIKANPSERHPSERTLGNKYVRVAKSQSLPLPPPDSWLSRSFIIGDFGNAQFLDMKVSDNIITANRRPPEILLEFPWNHKVDIWVFGCMLFELIHGHELFDSLSSDLPSTESVLHQMLLYTGERFSANTCQSTSIASQFLDPKTGVLKRQMLTQPKNLCQEYKNTGVLDPAENLEGANALIKKCLRLDLEDRPSAMDLLRDPWLNSKL